MNLTAVMTVLGIIESLATSLPKLIADGEAVIAAVKSQGADFEARMKAIAAAGAKALTDFADALDG